VAIISRGRLVAEGSPDALKRGLRGDSVTVSTQSASAGQVTGAVVGLNDVDDVRFDDGVLRARVPHGPTALPAILDALERRGAEVESATVARPRLDDVYLQLTGSTFESDDATT
jgi:ABC-2 type transport system ATP-binding protein